MVFSLELMLPDDTQPSLTVLTLLMAGQQWWPNHYKQPQGF